MLFKRSPRRRIARPTIVFADEITKAETFAQALALLEADGSPLKKKRDQLPSLERFATTFPHWLDIFYWAGEGSATEARALAKLRQLPAPRETLLETLEFAPEKSPLRPLIAEKLRGLGVTDLNGHAKPVSTDDMKVRLGDYR